MAVTITPVEVGILVLAVVGLVFARRILSSIKALVANAVTGIIALVVASWFGFGVALTPLTLVVTALAGIPGAILILLLSYSGIGFVPPGTTEQLLGDQLSHISQVLH